MDIANLSWRAIGALFAAFGMPTAAFAAEALKEIRLDWATYNPVSPVSKQQGLLEKEGRHQHRLGAVGGLQQGAGVPQRRFDRFRLDRGLGRVGRQDQRQPDLGGKRVAVTRDTSIR